MVHAYKLYTKEELKDMVDARELAAAHKHKHTVVSDTIS